MADDVVALMDHLGIEQADLVGYSMGGVLSASLLAGSLNAFARSYSPGSEMPS